MTLKEALEIIHSRSELSSAERVFLACGFTPLHLQTFLTAHLDLRLDGRKAEVLVGLFGDCAGNLERAAQQRVSTVLLIEWADLDPRLGARTPAGVLPSSMDDVLDEVESMLTRMEKAVQSVANHATIVVCGPSLPFPPISWTTPAHASSAELEAHYQVASFMARLSQHPRVRVLSAQYLAMSAPLGIRADVSSEIQAGFPYTRDFAERYALAMAGVLYPRSPKKGLILDLDNTMWSGIVGEIGIENVSWTLEGKAQVHALLQQTAASLADMGVLVGVASKNDPEVAMAAVRREDLIVPMSALFPIEVSWGAKSAAVSRILKTWNIAADSVVFVDDSQMELAEVERAHPGIECLRFEAERPDTVYQLLWRLRELFGKPAIGEEDRIRSQSLRRAQPPKEGANQEAVSSEFLHTIGAEIALDFRKDPNDSRAYELLNKTNQFNLNGRRLTEQEWRLIGEDPRSFVVTVSYQDKFGPLGKIAVLTGRKEPERLIVSSWVMSCRAFSRRIEHHTLERLIAYFKPAMLELDFVPTERNGPLQEFLSSIGCPLSSPVKLDPATFSKNRGPLPHEVTETYA